MLVSESKDAEAAMTDTGWESTDRGSLVISMHGIIGGTDGFVSRSLS